MPIRSFPELEQLRLKHGVSIQSIVNRAGTAYSTYAMAKADPKNNLKVNTLVKFNQALDDEIMERAVNRARAETRVEGET